MNSTKTSFLQLRRLNLSFIIIIKVGDRPPVCVVTQHRVHHMRDPPAAGECGADRVRCRQFGGTLRAWFSLENYLLREAVSLCLMQLCSSASWLQNRGRKSKRGTEAEAESVGRINSENVDQRRERKRSDGLDGRGVTEEKRKQ